RRPERPSAIRVSAGAAMPSLSEPISCVYAIAPIPHAARARPPCSISRIRTKMEQNCRRVKRNRFPFRRRRLRNQDIAYLDCVKYYIGRSGSVGIDIFQRVETRAQARGDGAREAFARVCEDHGVGFALDSLFEHLLEGFLVE